MLMASFKIMVAGACRKASRWQEQPGPPGDRLPGGVPPHGCLALMFAAVATEEHAWHLLLWPQRKKMRIEVPSAERRCMCEADHALLVQFARASRHITKLPGSICCA